MITTKEELKTALAIEKEYYYNQGMFKQKIVCSKNDIIFRYQKFLRQEEYYLNNSDGILHKLQYLYYKRKKNRLGQKLGFDILANCFDAGLHIHHVAPVTVNGDARIGKNCTIFGNVCIGVSTSGVPTIGMNCVLGYGSIVMGGIEIADNCTVGAGAVVTKSCLIPNTHIVGIPGKAIMK